MMPRRLAGFVPALLAAVILCALTVGALLLTPADPAQAGKTVQTAASVDALEWRIDVLPESVTRPDAEADDRNFTARMRVQCRANDADPWRSPPDCGGWSQVDQLPSDLVWIEVDPGRAEETPVEQARKGQELDFGGANFYGRPGTPGGQGIGVVASRELQGPIGLNARHRDNAERYILFRLLGTDGELAQARLRLLPAGTQAAPAAAPTPEPEQTQTPTPSPTPPQQAPAIGAQGTVDVDYDADNDNLIEISNLDQLHFIRYDLDGNGAVAPVIQFLQAAAFPNAAPGMGCAATCVGYELTADLDFDTNGNGSVDSGDSYWNDGAGWDPIGDAIVDGTQTSYTGTFIGNGHTISNLYINRNTDMDFRLGLFASISGAGFIRHVGLINPNVTQNLTTGTGASEATTGDTGTLVGWVEPSGRVAFSYAQGGRVRGGAGAGGLVGSLGGTVTASWSSVEVADYSFNYQGTLSSLTYLNAGGLVGVHYGGSIIASYSTGAVNALSRPGGVVGGLRGGGSGAAIGTVTDSYFDTNTSGQSDATQGKTTAQLQTPTGYTGIYANWNVTVTGISDPWDFGESSEYPALKADRDGGGVYTWQEFGAQGRFQGVVTVTAASDAVDEGAEVVFTVASTIAPPSNLTVNLERTVWNNCPTAECLDGSSVTAQTVTILSGQTSAVHTFRTDADVVDEYDGSVMVTVTRGGYAVGNPSSASTLVRDDEPPPVLEFSEHQYSASEDSEGTVVTVNIDKATYKSDVTVDWATVPDTTIADSSGARATEVDDFTPVSGTVTVPTHNGIDTALSVDFQITFVDDALDETEDETFLIELSNPQGATLGSRTRTGIRIFDNDDAMPQPAPTVAAPEVGELLVTWEVPPNTAANAYTGYNVQYCLAEGVVDVDTPAWTDGPQNVAVNVLSVLLEDLAPDTAYQARVRPVRVGSTLQTWSGIGTGSTIAPAVGAPGAPAAPTFGTPTASNLRVNLTAPSDTGTSAITGYNLRYRVQGSMTWTAAGPHTGSIAAIPGLLSNTVYEVRVQAVNSAGGGFWSPAGFGATTVDGAIYSAVLTVGRTTFDGRGYLLTNSIGALAPVSFTHSGHTYTVEQILYDLGTITLTMRSGVPTAPAFTLSLDATQFQLTSKAPSSNSVLSYVKPLGSLSWDEGQKVAVSIVPAPVPVVTITAVATTVAEGASAEFTVTANPAPLARMSVRLDVTASGNYGVTPGVSGVIIQPNQQTATHTIMIPDDSVSEPSGSVTVRVAPLVGYTVGTPASATVQLLDDDPGDLDYDLDADNLIEVYNLAQLNAMRWDPDGNGAVATGDQAAYTAAFPDAVSNMGCRTTCAGYELTADLNFDTNGNGRADSGDDYWNGGAGWTPIPNWNTTFDGGYHTISNLFIDRTGNNTGLFGSTGTGAIVRNVGLLNVNITVRGNEVGAIAGKVATGGDVARVYATGVIEAGPATASTTRTGGLVGELAGPLRAAWADVDVTGYSAVGGLAGEVDTGGSVAASFSLGDVVSRHATEGPTFYTGGVFGLGVSSAAATAYFDDSIRLVYFGTTTPHGGRTTAQLQSPTGYSGIYANWNLNVDGVTGNDDPWDFGTGSEYPALKADRNGDGAYTWQEFGAQGRRVVDYDEDNDNLIDVSSLAQLNAMRWDPNGDGAASARDQAAYAAAFPNGVSGMGCASTCAGYELTADLDFDTNRNGRADAGDPYWNGGAGWTPITNWNTTFDGGYWLISNLFINRNGNDMGLFGSTGASAIVRNVGLINVNISVVGDRVGAIAGRVATGGDIAQVYATGVIETGPATVFRLDTGGLVGRLAGALRAAWADVDVTGYNTLGGLVGQVDSSGNLAASFSLGDVVSRHPSGPGGFVSGVYGNRNGTVSAAYYDNSIRLVKFGDSIPATGRTTAQLQSPTGYTGIYASWNLDLDGDGTGDDPWDFGADDEYPALKGFGRRGSGTATIAANSSVVNEGEPAVFTIILHPPPTADHEVSVVSTTWHRRGRDTTQSTVTVPANRSTATHSVPVPDDQTYELNEFVEVEVISDSSYRASAPFNRAKVVVRENDPAPGIQGVTPSFASGRAQTTRQVSRPGSFTLHINGQPEDPSLGPLAYKWIQTHGPTGSSTTASEAGHPLHPADRGCSRTPRNAQFCVADLYPEGSTDSTVTWDVPSHAPLGDYTFELLATDSRDVFHSAGAITATVTGAAPPVAVAKVISKYQAAIDAGYIDDDNLRIQGPGTTVRLSGADSTSGAGSLRYSWRQTCDEVEAGADQCPVRPDPESIRGAKSATLSFTAPTPDSPDETITLRFELTVTDRPGNQDTDEVIIEVEDLIKQFNPDFPPQAIISDRGRWVKYVDGGDAVPMEVECTEAELEEDISPGNPRCHYEEPAPVTEGTRVTLDGSGSNDHGDGGRIVSYLWEQVGTTGGTLANANRSRATFTTPTGLTADAAYTIRLTVTDNAGLTDTDEVTIQVTVKPTADAGDLVLVDAGARFTLRGAGSGYPGETLSYDWSATDSPTQAAFGAPAQLAVRNLSLTAPSVTTDTSYTWTLTVTDSDGLRASDDVLVRVRTPRATAQMAPPVVNAGDDRDVIQGDAVQLDGSATQAANEPLIYEWTQTAGPEVLLYNPYSLTPFFTAPAVDRETLLTFRLEACIRDDFVTELICATDAVNVAVLTEPRPEPPPGPPELLADAGADQLVGPESVVTLDGSGSGGAPEGTSLTYRWRQTAGTRVNLQNPALPAAAFRAPQNDGAINLVLEFQLTVTDGLGRTATDTVRVEVWPASSGTTGPGVTIGGNRQYFLVPFPLNFLDELMEPGNDRTITIPVLVSISDGSDGNPRGSMVIVVQPPVTR